MDIISHTLTGFAVGTVVAIISDKDWKKRFSIMFAGALGGVLPDFDAISMWSKFDNTIGAFFNLKHSGQEIYFGKFWYSHHAAFHSLLAPIILIMIFILLSSIIRRKFKKIDIIENISQKRYVFLAFFLGFSFHLLEDMPTPSSHWGGVNFFFPSTEYIGGFGKVWWWNNYDLFLIIFTTVTLNFLISFLPKFIYKLKVISSISIFIIAIFIGLYQINTRGIEFSYAKKKYNHNGFELKSLEIQKDILGEKLFNIMLKIDKTVKVNF